MFEPLPDSLSFKDGACLAVAGRTAGGLARVWPLRGQSALVWGAAGAVGRMLVAMPFALPAPIMSSTELMPTCGRRRRCLSAAGIRRERQCACPAQQLSKMSLSRHVAPKIAAGMPARRPNGRSALHRKRDDTPNRFFPGRRLKQSPPAWRSLARKLSGRVRGSACARARRARERLEFPEHRRDEFGNGRVNVNGSLDDRIWRLGVHHVQNRVDGLVTADP